MGTYVTEEAMVVMADAMSWRGVTTGDLVCEAQRLDTLIGDIIAVPEILPLGNYFIPSGCTREEYVADTLTYYERVYLNLVKELERREKMPILSIEYPPKMIISAIKEKCHGEIPEVLSWNTQVFFHRGTWTFRCPLHGKDSHPSGYIYMNEDRWYCFGCGKGGDVVDAVSCYAKVPVREAITILGKYVGIEIKPIKPVSQQKSAKLPTIDMGEIA